MLGLLAPVGGILYDRFGARIVTAGGMAFCVAGLIVLHFFLDGRPDHMLPVMVGLMVFGIGQGLFISPNSSAIMATAPEKLTGEAGSLLNVVRYLGISTGISGASTLLALSLAAERGERSPTVKAVTSRLIEASGPVILALAGLGVLAAMLSLMRLVPHKPRGPQVPE